VAQTGSEINKIQKDIGQAKKAEKAKGASAEDIEKAKKQAAELAAQKTVLDERRKKEETIAAEAYDSLRKLIKGVGNLVHESVPVGETDKVLETWAPEGFNPEIKCPLSHHEILKKIGGYDPER
jgi:seryl-tRNA synthetase